MSQPEPTDAHADAGNELFIVAIDGPAGVGKSTVARRLADAVGLEYLDTGAMYRAVTFALLARGLDPADEDDAARTASQIDLRMDPDGTVIVDGIDATTQIRGPEVTRAVSEVAAVAAVRTELVSRQREWARRRGGGVLEGRDIGSVVFPDAPFKIYLSARPEVRASRRAKEVTDLDYDAVAADLARRDTFDSGRSVSPLTRADNSIEVDTSDLSIDAVVKLLVETIRG